MGVNRVGLMLVAVLAVAACASSPASGSYLTQTAESCPAVEALATRRSADPLPAEFRPVSAVRCTFSLTLGGRSSSGLTWGAALRSSGPFDGLARALRLPPEERSGDVACPAVFVPPELLALTDASGATLIPAVPGSVCGSARAEVRSAVDALEWVEIEQRG